MLGKNINSLKNSLEGKTVLLRLEVNVPVKEGKIVNDLRIKKTFSTIEFLLKEKAKVIAFGHIENKEGATLKPVYEYLKEKGFPVIFAPEGVSDSTEEKIKETKEGEMLLLENIRMHPEEKENNEEFSKRISSWGDVFVNEAFGASHRKHSSIVGIAKFLPSFFGFHFIEEIENLSKAFTPDKPFLFILGGAKFETKIPLIKKLLPKADDCFIGGAPAHSFFKYKGWNVGKSLLPKEDIDVSDMADDSSLLLPIDVVVGMEDGSRSIKKPDEVSSGETISDSGPESILMLKEKIESASFIIWNGPLGNYEEGFVESTIEIARAIAKSDCISMIGGGDTVATIEGIGMENNFTFISTGGGAMLEFLTDETLPGIDAVNSSPGF